MSAPTTVDLDALERAGEYLDAIHPSMTDRQIAENLRTGAERARVKAESYRDQAEKLRARADDYRDKLGDVETAEAMYADASGLDQQATDTDEVVIALERHGIVPDRGPVVVTGAAGGVGSVAVSILSSLGYHVIASTGRSAESPYLIDLGAAEVISRDELAQPAKPLAKERWAGGVDAVGSHTLANVLSMTSYGGAVAACGLAGGMDLPASVAPFILRGVSLLGIDSVMAPKAVRMEAWRRIGTDLDLQKLASLSTTIGFDDIIDAAHDIVDGKIRGRVVVDM